MESFVDMCMIHCWWVFIFDVMDRMVLLTSSSLNSLVFHSSLVSIYSLRKQERILHCLLFSLSFSYSHLLLLWVLVLLDQIWLVIILYHWLLVIGFWWYCQVCVYLLNKWEWSDEMNWRYSQWRDFNWDWLDLWWLVCLWMSYQMP